MNYKGFCKKIVILIAFLLTTNIAGLFAQSLKVPMIMSEKTVNSLAWSLDSSLFAYTDGTDIVIRDSNEFFVRHTIHTNYKNILDLKFVDPVFDYDEEDQYYILLVTDTNLIEIRQLYFFEDDIGNKLCADNVIFELQGSEEIKGTSFACTPDVRFIVLGFEDGSFTLFNYNIVSEEYIEEDYEIGETPIISTDISTNQDMLLTCTQNGIVYIWNNKMEAISEFSFDEEYDQKVYFNDDNKYPILFSDSTRSISKYNLSARRNRDFLIETDNTIKDYTVSIDRKTALVLDSKDILNVYNLDNGEYIGFIPNFSDSPITHFQIDYSQTRFLIAHEDNTVFILEISKVLFPKNSTLPNANIIHMDDEDALERLYEEEPEETPEEEITEEVLEEEEEQSEENEKHVYEALALIRYKNTDSINFKLKVSYIPKPYILGVSLSFGFTEYKLIQPFYFGGVLEPHVGFPQKKFPYKYELGGAAINGPLIIGGKLYAPFGICVFPFQENIEFYVEFAPGLSLNMMWDAKFGKDAITSKLYPAFYGALRTGFAYKGFTFFMEGNYDAILGFGVSAGIGYSLNFNVSSTPNYAPSLEDQ